jgi:hypothetical protein
LIDLTNLNVRINLLEERITLYEQLENKRNLNNEQQKSYINDLKELVKLKRISRGLSDQLFFMYEYFSEDRNPDNQGNLIPAGIELDDAPDFHTVLCK